MAEERKKLFLTNVHLKGFKSIIDVDVEIKKGLNILIGKNGAGKSNFLEGIYQTDRFPYKSELIFDYVNFKYVTSEKIVIGITYDKTIKKAYTNKEFAEELIDPWSLVHQTFFVEKEIVYNNQSYYNNEEIEVNGKKIKVSRSLRTTVNRSGFLLPRSEIIPFNNSQDLEFISNSGSIKIEGDRWPLFYSINVGFLEDVFNNFEEIQSYSADLIKDMNQNSVLSKLILPVDVIGNLKNYTPIENIRFNPNINVYHTDKETIIDNIKIDFKINGNWLPWSQLSDGTKRLFYMVAEITSHKGGLVLVEEPELGVHPHQFDKIMEFLMEQAEDKQIIVSTHSPQALNHLTVDELDHLMIAKFDNKKGTQIKHLTPAQTKKAKAYINKVGFFSDYWLLSDLG